MSVSLCSAVFILIRPLEKNGTAEKQAWTTILSEFHPLSTLILLLFSNTFVLTLQLGSGAYWWSDSVFYLLFFPTAALFVAFLSLVRRRNGTLGAGFMCQRSMICAFIFAMCVGGTFGPMFYWVFFWQQIVRGATAMRSALGALPLIIGFFATSIAVGARPRHIGYCAPRMMLAVLCMALGAGLTTIIRPDMDIDPDKWIGGLLLLGLGAGALTQLPTIIAQTVLDPQDVFMGVGMLHGAYSFGAGAFFAIGQAIFTESLRRGLHNIDDFDNLLEAAKLSSATVLTEGAAFDGTLVGVSADSMLKAVWVVVAVSCLAILPANVTEWRKVRKRNDDGRTPETVQVVGSSGSPGRMNTLFQSAPARPSTAFSDVTAR